MVPSIRACGSAAIGSESHESPVGLGRRARRPSPTAPVRSSTRRRPPSSTKPFPLFPSARRGRLILFRLRPIGGQVCAETKGEESPAGGGRRCSAIAPTVGSSGDERWAADARVRCRIDASEQAAFKISFSLINFKLVPASCSHHGPIRSDSGSACVRASMSFPCAAASGPPVHLPPARSAVPPSTGNARVNRVRPSSARTTRAGAAGAHAMGVGPVGHPEGSGHRRPRQRHACPGRRFRTHPSSHAHTHVPASMHVHSMRRKGVRVCLRECLIGCT